MPLFKRSGDGGAWTLRIACRSICDVGRLSVYFCLFQDISVGVETLEPSGDWPWGVIPDKESFDVAYVKGFYPADVWTELMANLISVYIGVGITRKVFQAGK